MLESQLTINSRGKKVFRKFHNGLSSGALTEEDDEASADELQLLRRAGHEARRPLTRSAVKPKLLFQEEIKQRKLENNEASDDEEAATDIEIPIATPSRGKGKMVMQIAESTQEATPPPTGRKAKRGMFHLHLFGHMGLANGLQKYHSTVGCALNLHIAPAALRAEPSAVGRLWCVTWIRKLAVSALLDLSVDSI